MFALLFAVICTALVGSNGLEPSTSRLSGARSNHLSYEPIKNALRSLVPLRCRFASLSLVFTFGGDEGNRTLDPLLAGQVLSQLSYTPMFEVLVPVYIICCVFLYLNSLSDVLVGSMWIIPLVIVQR